MVILLEDEKFYKVTVTIHIECDIILGEFYTLRERIRIVSARAAA